MPERTRIKNVKGASRLSNIWNFFGAIQMISCRDWWPRTKPGYITMTQRQSNNQWSGGIAAHPAPKIPSAKIRWKSSCRDFLGSRRHHHHHWLSSKGPNYQRGVLLISAGAVEGHFEGKTPWEGHQGGSCSCTTMPQLTGHLQPRRNWYTWASNVLITHPILWICPRRTTIYSLDWKKKLKGHHFSFDPEVIAAAETWFDDKLLNFFEWLAKVRATD